MAIMIISRCDITWNVAISHQALWELLSLFELNKLLFQVEVEQSHDSYMLTIEQFVCRIEESM